MLRFLMIFLAAILLAGCGRGQPAPSGDQPQSPVLSSSGPWTLRFTQSGGIMGMMRTMEIHSDGKATITDERTNQTVTIQLEQGEISVLKQVASGTTFQAPKGPSGCADCFVYQVEVMSGSEKTFEAQVDDVNLESSGLSTLVENLRKFMERSLKNLQ